MMLYEGDARRCRRCKRRRMDDEPPEVQQYKTCAKCRIIERTKKKSRKPLAEETMRYGMRQFQEQNQNANFIHDDIFASDQLLSDLQASRDAGIANPSKQSLNTQFALHKPSAFASARPANYSYGQPSLAASAVSSAYQSPQLGGSASMPGASALPSATAAAIAAAAINGADQSAQSANRQQNKYRQHKQKQEGDRAKLPAPSSCELCGGALDADDNMCTMYRLCKSCYSNPYAKEHVYSDFDDFLLKVVKDKDAEAMTFISELASHLVESLNTSKAIRTEEQFRKAMMDSLTSIYVDPLIASLTPLKFTRTSSNVGEVNNTAPVVSKVSQKYHYTLTPPLKQTYNATTETGTTSLEMLFLIETNLIIIKKRSKKAVADYSVPFLKALSRDMKAKGFTFDDEPAKVYAELQVSDVGADQFARDFKLLQKQIANIQNNEAAASANNGQHVGHEQLEHNASGDAESNEKLEDDAEDDEEKFEDEDEEDLGEESSEAEDPDDLDPAFAA
ncbi:hypothetical protein A9F13_26g00077 [Clavispora lusitaniae]|uniref:Uncharacterized protein n=1 Tax=Clavispora lusitaniae TaxID=36911 RepID=A0AA91SZN3_CLALS|nr:hypothetical protein A9F13_26g00077 [Clavispora lusitaniae]